MPVSLPYTGVSVACPVTVPYTRTSTRSATGFVGLALSGLLAASGLAKEDIDGLAVSSFTMGPDTTIALTEHFDMTPRWIEWIPTGGASGIMALRRAARAVQCGDAEVVACIGADTADPLSFARLVDDFSTFSTAAVAPYGNPGPNGPFALITEHFLRRFGLERADLGRIAVAQRANAAGNANALLGAKPLSLDEYLAAPPIVEPLHLFDCVMPCAGAEAFLVMSRDRANDLGLASARIAGSVERHNAFHEDPVAIRGGWSMDADALWSQAGLVPADVDCVQTYDDYPVIAAMQISDLAFCDKHALSAFLRQHDLRIEGDFPLNTCGGQLSCGQAGAAGGFLPIVEALRQVTGQPLGRQVPGARVALASGYGMVTYDRCLATAAAILEGET
ncbi:thiolase family protein [Flavisphingomonas formosensis]|uniref:thiolase family protein n=1 Tax=Flavisphingomonas formosensis TaxID=861534 RepID=UPI0012F91C72|nr:thiolase family protein [Sphingomonas formosensis]